MWKKPKETKPKETIEVQQLDKPKRKIKPFTARICPILGKKCIGKECAAYWYTGTTDWHGCPLLKIKEEII